MYDARGRICVHRYAGHVFYILHVEVNMVTKYKAAVFIIAAMFSSIASAAYTTMTIEGVKQANGVWTTAGVMDTQGFVRTTGAVSVYGTTRNLPMVMEADTALMSRMLKLSTKLAGPLAVAATAYDVYQWATSTDISSSGDKWTQKNESSSDVGFSYGSEWTILNFAGVYSSAEAACRSYNESRKGMSYWSPKYVLTPSGAGKYQCACKSADLVYTTCNASVTAKNCSNGSQTLSCVIPTDLPDDFFLRLPDPSLPVLSSGWSKLPSLAGQPIPIKGVGFKPYSEWMGDPYFKNGNWYRDRMDISPSGTTSSPTRVKVDIGPVKIEGATDPGTVPDTGPAGGGGTAPQPEKEKPTFCEANPMSIACAEMGELKDEKLEVEERPVDVSYTPWGSSTSQCPADKVIPLWDDQSITISYSPVCQFASLLRPLVIALAFVAAGFIVAGITRKGAES